MSYIDGFFHPIPRAKLEEYRRLVETVAEVWKEHGALEYREFLGDDMHLEGTRSFVDLAQATGDTAILFGWVAFESREARDLINERVASDPRMADLMASTDSGFDPGHMAYGGFRPFVPGDD